MGWILFRVSSLAEYNSVALMTWLCSLSAVLDTLHPILRAVVLQHPAWLVFHVTRPPSVVQPTLILSRVALNTIKHTTIELLVAQWSD